MNPLSYGGTPQISNLCNSLMTTIDEQSLQEFNDKNRITNRTVQQGMSAPGVTHWSSGVFRLGNSCYQQKYLKSPPHSAVKEDEMKNCKNAMQASPTLCRSERQACALSYLVLLRSI